MQATRKLATDPQRSAENMNNLITIAIALLLVCAGPGFAIDKETLLRQDGSLNREAAQRALDEIELARIVLVKALPDDREGGPLPFGTYFFMEDGNDFLRRYLVFRRSDGEQAVRSWLDRLTKALDEGFEVERSTFWTEEELRQDYDRMKNGGDPHGILGHIRDVWPPNENDRELEILLRKRFWEAKIALIVADRDHALAVTEAVESPDEPGEMRYAFLQFRRTGIANGPKKWIMIGHGAPIARRVDFIDIFLARFTAAIMVDGELPELMAPEP